MTGEIAGSATSIQNAYNLGNVNRKSTSNRISGIGNRCEIILNVYNRGEINKANRSVAYEIGDSSNITSAYYQVRTVNANGGTGKSEAEMRNLTKLEEFINLLNEYVVDNNIDSNNTVLKRWKLQDGVPAFE